MNGNASQPVLAPAPVDEPRQPRYYRVRPARHRVLGVLAVVAFGVAMGAVLLRTDLLRGSSETASRRGDIGVLPPAPIPVADEIGPDRAPFVPSEVELDIDSAVVVGDSITEASAQAIIDTLGGEDVNDVDVEGLARRRIEIGSGNDSKEPLSGIKEIYQLIANGADPDVWVIALGTNDVGQYPDAEAYGRLIDSVLGMLPDDVPLVWVDVFRPDSPDHNALFNEVLHDRIDDRDHAAVAPWSAFASAPDQTILRSDHLHPNASGTEVFAAVIAAGIADATG